MLLMNELGELSGIEGSIKSFAVSFAFCFTVSEVRKARNVTGCRRVKGLEVELSVECAVR